MGVLVDRFYNIYTLLSMQSLFIQNTIKGQSMQLHRDQSVQIFKSFISKVQELNFQQTLLTVQHQYSVREFKLPQLSPSTVEQLYQSISLKFTRNPQLQSQLNWWENQLRIFVWTLVFYVHINSTTIQSLTANDWMFFSRIFPHKMLILFEYQSINILREHGQAKKWIIQEDQIFIKLVNQKGLQCKWSELAKLLYINSEKKYFRTPKQCRQRWLNHLDPSKSKSEWSTREDFILIKYVYEKEKRWAEISKLLLNKRNQHSIKNRFKSLITKQLKFHKQKLTEKQLIESIYHRYRTHLTKGNNNNRVVDDGVKGREKMERKEKMEEEGNIMRENIRGLQRSNMHNNNIHQNNTSNNSTVIGRFPSLRHHLSQSPAMYPFTWYKKQQSFIPYRKSQQYFPYSQYQQIQPNTLKRNFITSSYNSSIIEELHNRRERDNNNNNDDENDDNDGVIRGKVVKGEGDNNYFPQMNANNNNNNYSSKNYVDYYSQQQQQQQSQQQRVDDNDCKRYPLPAQHYSPQNHFYSQAFGSSSQLQLGSNYQQFLPIQQQLEQSQRQMMMNSHDVLFNSLSMERKKRSVEVEMDQEQRKVRAEIFLLENPIEVVRGFFYKCDNGKNIVSEGNGDNNIDGNRDNDDSHNM